MVMELPNIDVVKASGEGDFGRAIRNPNLNMFRLKYITDVLN